MAKTCLKLGTRKSLLAWAQSTWVAQQVEKLNPEISVELVGIETRGDRILDIPLTQVEGKEFFVAEIDEALQTGKVDFTVHSLKDLSLQRPEAFTCAAIPERENPRDVIVFGPRAQARLKQGLPLKIGTSSPRRLETIPPFLRSVLPWVNGRSPQDPLWVEIRGNVNTRLSRVHLEETSERYLDGVVLAFAGLIRLWRDPQGQLELKKLLSSVRWMVLPLTVCPSAPGQGALAIECRRSDVVTSDALRKLHHTLTAEQVRLERQELVESGGGCHQRFGATVFQTSELGAIFSRQGKNKRNEDLSAFRWNMPQKPEGGFSCQEIWDGSAWRQKGEEVKESSARKQDPLAEATLSKAFEKKPQAAFIAHSRAVSKDLVENIVQLRIWTSGISSWSKLAQMGVWVEGCGEGFGFAAMKDIVSEKVLELPALNSWMVLTHDKAQGDWQELGMSVLSTYSVIFNYGNDAKSKLKESSYIFWSSGSQFDQLRGIAKKDAYHACGPGKTAAHLRNAGVTPHVFPSAQHWRSWLSTVDRDRSDSKG